MGQRESGNDIEIAYMNESSRENDAGTKLLSSYKYYAMLVHTREACGKHRCEDTYRTGRKNDKKQSNAKGLVIIAISSLTRS